MVRFYDFAKTRPRFSLNLLFSDEAGYFEGRVALDTKLDQTIVMFLTTLIVSSALSQGSDSVEWFFFELETNGETAEFFSTTSIRPNGESYNYFWTLISFEIQLTNEETGFVFPWEDISGDLPVEYFGGDGTVAGPAPCTILELNPTYPEPPEKPEITGIVGLEIMPDGLGRFYAQDLTFGAYLGYALTGLRVSLVANITANGEAEQNPYDLNGDGVVGFVDLTQLLSAWGQPCNGCPEDFDGNGSVGFTDLTALLSNWE